MLLLKYYKRLYIKPLQWIWFHDKQIPKNKRALENKENKKVQEGQNHGKLEEK